MANAQLVNYIKQQIEMGETESPIKNSLRSVGWSDPDINDAWNAASVQSVAAPAQKAAPFAEPKKFVNLNSMGPSTSPATAPAGAAAASAAAISTKPMATEPGTAKVNEFFFQPKSGPGPVAASPMRMDSPAKEKSNAWAWIIISVLTLLFLASAAGAFMFFKSKSDLTAQVTALEAQLASAGSGSTNGSGGQESAAQAAELASLRVEKEDLTSQLSLFLPLTYVSSTVGSSTVNVAAPITLRGTLAGGEKVPYTLKTSKSITVGLKNYKDEKVMAALKPFLDSQVQLTGIPTAGAREITVTAVNGTSIQ